MKMNHRGTRVDDTCPWDVAGRFGDRGLGIAAHGALAFCLACIAIGLLALYFHGPV
jgi:hypothetical protein